MNSHFNIHQWSEPDPKDVKTFIHNYFMNGTEFPEWQMREVLPAVQTDSAFMRQYIWSQKDVADKAFKVDIISAFSHDDAKEHFQELLENNMRQLSEFEKVESLLGYNAYVDDADNMSYGLFMLANLVIRIHSVGSTNISCNGFIKEVHHILDHTYAENIADTAEVPVPILSSPGGNEILTRERTILNIRQTEWHKLILDGPGKLHFSNGSLNYTSEEPGTANIDLYTIRRNGVLKSTLMLTVK